MTKKTFLSIAMVFLGLHTGVGNVLGQGIGGLIGGIDPENPATWFYVNLTAQPSTPACGTNPGQVWLRSVAPTGNEENPYADSNPYILPEKTVNPYDEENQSTEYGHWNDGFNEGKYGCENGQGREDYPDWYCTNNDKSQGFMDKRGEGWYAGWDWYNSGHYLNETNPVGFAESVSSKGYTVVYAPGFEDMNVFGNVFSAYASFYGKAQENYGWYFAGWSFTEGDTDLGVGDENGVLFRVLPAATAGEANMRNEYVYATFKPVMVSNYKVNGLINGTGNSTTVVFDAIGERVTAEDFKEVTCSDANFSAEITSCDANKVTVTVTYNGSANGEFRGNVTLASMSGCSQLTAPVYARVGVDATNEATLYDGKTPTERSGTLLNMIAEANNTDKIVVLNKNYTENLTINANVTLNFNGYTIKDKDLTVEGGEVTIAYDKYGGNGKAVSVTGGKLILNGGEFSSLQISNGATVEQNGATITGATTNNGTLVTIEGRFEGGLTSAGTLTVNGGAFEGETAITVNGGTAIFNKATISGTETGILVEGGETTISSKLVSVYGGTNAVKQQTAGSIVLQNGKFDGATPLAGTINLQGGYFKTNTPGIAIPSGKKVLNVLAGTEYAEGYRYFIGDDATGIGVCRIGTTSYATLEAALAYANNNPTQDVVIIMTNDYTLPAGYYTLPAKATLIVPMSDKQETGYEIINRVSNNSVSHTDYVQPYEFRRLTFAYGVNIDVHGTIELSGTQRASDDAYATLPHGPYGHLVMEEGSHMTLQNGSKLRAWGYMTGKGETDARRGSTVHEQFQMGDWKGGGVAFSMLAAENTRVFPITQYYIQNVESPVKYHPGAVLTTTTSVSANFGNMGITAMANDIKIVGVSGVHTAMFLMDQEADAENTWVRKWYDAEHDVQTYEVNSGAHLGSMVLDLGKLGTQPLVMNSGYFVLPITNNMKIHLLSGMMDFTQTTSLLPGAEVEVDKESVIKIVKNSDSSVYSGALYVYDADDWSYAGGKGDAANTYYTKVVPYSPSFNGKPNKRSETDKLDDAKINVHGSFDSGEGTVYTTPGGANIFSTNEDAGTFVFSDAAPTTTSDVYQYVMSSKTSGSYAPAVQAESAKLKNGNNTYTETAGAIQGLAFIYRDGAWQEPMIQTANDMIVTYNSNCFTADVSMMTYLNLVCNVTDFGSQQAMLASPMKEDVKNQVAIVHAPDNIAEYLVGSKIASQLPEAQGNTPTPQEYEYLKRQDKYVTMFDQIKTAQIDPQIAAIKEAGYDFGAAVQKVYIKPQEWLEIAGTAHLQLGIDDVSYYEDLYNEGIANGLSDGNYSLCTQAVNEYLEYIEANKLNPYIEGVEGNADNTYSDADGAGRLFILMDKGCQWWEVEKKDNLYHCIHPNNDTYYYWDEDEGGWGEKRFTITWKNWDGKIVKTANADGNLQDYDIVKYGTMAEFLGTNPTREATNDYTYDFTGWSPALDSVKSDVTYTATYTQKPRTYTIIFLNEGGVEIERQFLTLNEWPVCENTPTKVGHTLEWTPAIAAVTRDTTYTAKWLEEAPEKYKITFFDYDGKKILKQGDVNVGVVPTPPADPAGKPATGEFTYVFDHWAPALEEVSATSPKSYTAVYREVAKKYTVIFQNEDGSEIERHEYAYGETPVCSATPTKAVTAQYSYTFAWDPQIETVRGAATYKAVFTSVTNRYTVTLKANPSGACTFTGAGTFDYGTAIAIARVDNEGYTFSNWTDKEGNVVSVLPTTLTGDVDLVANFTVADPDWTITWKSEDGNTTLAEVGQKAGTATTYTGATPTKAATAQNTFTFYGWSTAANGGGTIYKNGMTPKATDNATYYAYFSETPRKYTISWKNEAGTADIEVDYEQPYGASIEYNSATPTKHATAKYTYTFDGWSTSAGGAVAALPATVSGDATFYAHFAATTNTYTITWLRDDGTLIDRTEVAYDVVPTHADPTKAATPEYTYTFTGWDVEPVAVTGIATYTAIFSSTPVLTAGIGVTVEAEAKAYASITITSNGFSSGQITNAGAITSCANAYFDLEMKMAARTWYAVAVPWRVDATNGIIINNTPQRLGVDIDVLYYDGVGRAANGKGGNWLYLESTEDKTMQPGTFYMIYLAKSASAIRFQKKAGADLLTINLSVEAHPSANVMDAGWNGIANPALFHAYINASSNTYGSTNYGQKYNPSAKSYTAVPMNTGAMIVGEPIFVQVSAQKDITVRTEASGWAAPRRAPRVDNASYEVQISDGEEYTDRIFLQTMEDKEDRYIIELDLAKAGISTSVAQMWVERYNTQLCVNTTAPVGKTATYPLGISVPENGTYQISSATEMQNNQELYVTRNGNAIWNLAYGPYTVTLDKGTYSEYGIKLIQSQSPAVTTGVDQTTTDKLQIQKVLIDNKVYIVREGELYTITGQKVE